jgi:BlaI family penicillinase repressor
VEAAEMPRPVDKLSRREREILDILFALGNNGSAEEIRERLIDPPSYSAVRAMLAKLEAKGVVRHRAEGLRYVYSPVTAKSTAQKKAVVQLLKVFFGGSPSQAATALLKQENWSDEELEALRLEIDVVRKNRRQS